MRPAVNYIISSFNSSSLEIDCPSDISVQISDLADIADHCKFLDSLCFTSFKIAPNSISDFPIPFAPLRFLIAFVMYLSSHCNTDFSGFPS